MIHSLEHTNNNRNVPRLQTKEDSLRTRANLGYGQGQSRHALWLRAEPKARLTPTLVLVGLFTVFNRG